MRTTTILSLLAAYALAAPTDRSPFAAYAPYIEGFKNPTIYVSQAQQAMDRTSRSARRTTCWGRLAVRVEDEDVFFGQADFLCGFQDVIALSSISG